MLLVLAAASVASFAAVFLLPGLGLQSIYRRLADAPDDRAPEVHVGVALSIMSVCAVGYVLIALRLFSFGALALLILPLALLGVIPALRAASSLRPLTVAVVLLLTAPIAWPAFRPGHAPGNNFNGFYWVLDDQLAAAHGIPQWVSEYGQHVRWQPDYLNFSLLVSAYRGLLAGMDPLIQMDLWKLPATIFVLSVLHATLRLWFSRPAAYVGLGLFAATTLGTAKLGNARPEIMGFAVGLVAVVLAVRGLRNGRSGLYLLAGVLIAMDVSIHTIGALVAGILLVAATVVEFAHSRRLLGTIMRSFVLACVVLLATGWALQGRAVVDVNAQPLGAGAVDPTLEFFELTEGPAHIRPPVARVLHRIAHLTTTVWLDEEVGLVLGAFLVLAIAAVVVTGSRRSREGIAVAFGLAAGLTLPITWFTVHYETFVPQTTANRFAQWAPLCAVMIGAAGFDLTRQIQGHRKAISVVGAAAAVGIGVVLATYPPRLPVDADHRAALSELQRVVQPGDVLISNAETHGLLEYSTSAEVPLEGRQPVIEKPEVLRATNIYVGKMVRYFAGQGIDPGKEFNARWILITDNPAGLATRQSFRPPHHAATDGLTRVWQRGAATLYEASGKPTRRVGPPTRRVGPFLVLLIVLLTIGWLTGRWARSEQSGGMTR